MWEVELPPARRPTDAPAPKVAFAYRAVRFLHRHHLVGDARMEQLRQRYGSPDYRNVTGVMRGVNVKAVTNPTTTTKPLTATEKVLAAKAAK